MEIQSKKLIGFDRYRFGDRQLLIGIGIGSADQEKLLIGRSLKTCFVVGAKQTSDATVCWLHFTCINSVTRHNKYVQEVTNHVFFCLPGKLKSGELGVFVIPNLVILVR